VDILIKYWNSICRQFDRGEYWFSESQCDDALRLLGRQPEEASDDVYDVRMMNYGASPEACAEGWAWWLDRKRIPDALLRHLDNQMLLPEECRDTLMHIVTAERQALEELEAELREIEDADRAEATKRALVLKGKKAALWDRFQRMNTSSHHRAERSLKEGPRKPLEPAPGEWNSGDTAGPAVPVDPEPAPVVDKGPVADERAVLRAEADTVIAQVSNSQEDTTTILANQNAPKETRSGTTGRAQTSGHWQVAGRPRPPGRLSGRRAQAQAKARRGPSTAVARSVAANSMRRPSSAAPRVKRLRS
jgi:hypothetical protein